MEKGHARIPNSRALDETSTAEDRLALGPLELEIGPPTHDQTEAGDMTGYLVSSDGFGGHGHLAEGAPPAFGAQPPEIEQKIILLRIEAALLEAGLSVNDSANLSQKLAHIVFPQKGPKS